jgi:hypothetical protein
MPEHWSSFFEEYKKGKSGKSFDDLNYNDLVLLNTADLQHAFRPMY